MRTILIALLLCIASQASADHGNLRSSGEPSQDHLVARQLLRRGHRKQVAGALALAGGGALALTGGFGIVESALHVVEGPMIWVLSSDYQRPPVDYLGVGLATAGVILGLATSAAGLALLIEGNRTTERARKLDCSLSFAPVVTPQGGGASLSMRF